MDNHLRKSMTLDALARAICLTTMAEVIKNGKTNLIYRRKI